MHVQFLVGLCCLRHSPEAVEVTIGDMIRDQDIDKLREVDVTVKFADADGSITAFSGIEVKDEARPLDVTEVEQLWAKLSLMPEITHRAIVSSSGYAGPAITKARARQVELYEFKDWAGLVQTALPLSSFVGRPVGSLHFQAMELRWVGDLRMTFNPESPLSQEMFVYLQSNPPILNVTGEPHPKHPLLSDFQQELAVYQLNVLRSEKVVADAQCPPPEFDPASAGDCPFGPIIPVDAILEIEEPVFLKCGASTQRISSVRFRGEVQWYRRRIEGEYKIMCKLGTQTAFAAAAISRIPGEDDTLVAVLLSPTDTFLQIVPIRLSVEHRNMIRNLRLR